MEQLIGKKLGKYQIQAELGRGGMAVVYVAYDPDLERAVAIKVMAPHLVWQEGFVERFLREARTAARLRHPNIVTIHDVGSAENQYYFVMEYVQGQSLKDFIKNRERLKPHEAIYILKQLAAALDHAHRNSLVHRDVKPANVMLNAEWHVTLMDFGIVRAASESRLTSAGSSIGTPQYMSPEQIRNQDMDGRSDLYSMAIVAYEMLSGTAPFEGDTTGVLFRQINEPVPPITARCPELPRTVEPVLMRALAKQPQARYASCVEFVGALEQALAGRQVERERPVERPAVAPVAPVAPPAQPYRQPAARPQTPPPVPQSARPAPRSVPLSVVVVGGVLLLVCLLAAGGGAAAWVATHPPTPEIQEVIVPVTSPPGFTPDSGPTPAPDGLVATTPPPDEVVPSPLPERATDTPVPPVTPVFYQRSIGQSVQGRDLNITAVGYERGVAVVLVGNIDGSQANTYELASRLGAYFDRYRDQVPPDTAFYILPSINPDGYAANDRYNARGVDLNRNWDTADWDPDPGEPGYPDGKPGAGGAYPSSEPETSALVGFLLNLVRDGRDVRLVLLHSSVTLDRGQGKVFPGSVTGRLHTASVDLAGRVAAITGYNYETVWSSGYTTSGELITWCAEENIVSVDAMFSRNDSASALEATFARVLLEAAR